MISKEPATRTMPGLLADARQRRWKTETGILFGRVGEAHRIGHLDESGVNESRTAHGVDSDEYNNRPCQIYKVIVQPRAGQAFGRALARLIRACGQPASIRTRNWRARRSRTSKIELIVVYSRCYEEEGNLKPPRCLRTRVIASSIAEPSLRQPPHPLYEPTDSGAKP